MQRAINRTPGLLVDEWSGERQIIGELRFLRSKTLACASLIFACHGTSVAQRLSNWRSFKAVDGFPEVSCSQVSASVPGRVLVRHLHTNAVSELDGYSVRTTVLPEGTIGRPYASPSGQLWLVTSNGLAEFHENAWHFYRVPDVEAAVADPQTRPWITLEPIRHGRILVLIPDRLLLVDVLPSSGVTATRLREAEQTPLKGFRSMQVGRDGNLLIAGVGGIARSGVAARNLRPDSVWEEHAFPDLGWTGIGDPSEDSGGGLNVLVRGKDGLKAVSFDGEEWSAKPFARMDVVQAWKGPDKGWWALAPEALLQWREPLQKWVEVEEISVRRYLDVAVEPGGSFWLATSDGLFRYAPPCWRRPADSPGGDAVVQAAAADANSGVWFLEGRALHGVELPQGNRSIPLPQEIIPDTASVQGLYPLRNGGVLVALSNALFRFNLREDRFVPIRLAGATGARALGTLRDGRVCLEFIEPEASNNIALVAFDGLTARPFTSVPHELGLGPVFLKCMQAQNGDFWLSSESGTAWLHDGKWKSFVSADQGEPRDGLAFLETPEGRIWCASHEQIWEYDGKEWTAFRRGLEQINGLLRAADGTIWIASNGGVYRFASPNWFENSVEEGLSSSVIRSLVEDKRGRIWAGTSRGLALYHPDADLDPPQTTLQPLSDQDRSLPEGSTLTVNFNAVDKWKFTPPFRLLYSSRLDDREWSMFSEATSISLGSLAPGKHYFQVRSIDRNGNMDPRPVQLEFAVVLPWYKESRLVFISILGLLLALFFAGLAVNRHRRLKLSYNEVEQKVAERTQQLERAHLELAHHQKMTALGTLAAGIAHDFNNILSIVKGSAQIIEQNLEDPAKVRVRVDRIKTVVDQGSGIVKAMLGFSRDPVQPPVVCPLKEVVIDTLTLLGDRFLREVQVKFDPGASGPHIFGSRDLIQQILLNLIFNAAESMEKPKVVKIRIETFDHLPSNLVLGPVSSSHYAAVLIQDSGCGIPPENMDRIFEPFFTTKSMSSRRGTGLGLTMVYELAKKLGAGLNVQSALGQGSTFSLYLPVVEKDLAVEANPDQTAIPSA